MPSCIPNSDMEFSSGFIHFNAKLNPMRVLVPDVIRLFLVNHDGGSCGWNEGVPHCSLSSLIYYIWINIHLLFFLFIDLKYKKNGQSFFFSQYYRTTFEFLSGEITFCVGIYNLREYNIHPFSCAAFPPQGLACADKRQDWSRANLIATVRTWEQLKRLQWRFLGI